METRKLDRLALVGGIIAFLAVVVQVYFIVYAHQNPDRHSQKAFLKTITSPEMRADYVMLLSNTSDSGEIPKRPADAIRDALDEFPESPRIQLHAGILLKSKDSEKALEKSAQLDPKNAMPLYLLASRTSERKDFNEAVKLIEKGNALPYVDLYGIPHSIVARNLDYGAALLKPLEMIGTSKPIKLLARGLSKHASELHKEGETTEALSILNQVREMGWKLTRTRDRSNLDILASTNIVLIAQIREIPILESLHDTSGIRALETERDRISYLRAGVWQQIETIWVRFYGRVTKYLSLTVMPAAAAFEAWIVLASIIMWLTARRKARNHGNGENIPEWDNVKSPSTTALLRLYVLTFAFPWLVAALPMYTLTIGREATFKVFDAYFIALAIWGPNLITISVARYLKKADPPKTYSCASFWKRVWGDKKSFALEYGRAQRLSWFHAGAMFFLLICGLISIGAMKLTIDAYPWQPMRAILGVADEQKYAADLVAGKVKVPEKAIREQEAKMREDDRKWREKDH